jgi:two-component system KDP operon response regulator KdpE
MPTGKILIVDDDKDTRVGLDARLRASGYNVVSAADATTALTKAVKERPGLVVLDLGMPGGDGFLVLQRMKSNILLRDIPVIVLSARDPEGNRGKALAAGAAAYFQKPADNDALMGEVASRIEGEPQARAS